MKTLKLSLLCLLFSSFSLAFAAEAGPAEQAPTEKVAAALAILRAEPAASIQEQLKNYQTIQDNFKEGVNVENIATLANLVGRPGKARFLVLDGLTAKIGELSRQYTEEIAAAVAAIVNQAEGADLRASYQTVQANIKALTQEQITSLSSALKCHNTRPAVRTAVDAKLAPAAPDAPPAPVSEVVAQLTTKLAILNDTSKTPAEQLEAYLFVQENLAQVTGDNLDTLCRLLDVQKIAGRGVMKVVLENALKVKIAELEATIEAAAVSVPEEDHTALDSATESLYAVKDRLSAAIAALQANRRGLIQQCAAQGALLVAKVQSLAQEKAAKEQAIARAAQNKKLAEAVLGAISGAALDDVAADAEAGSADDGAGSADE